MIDTARYYVACFLLNLGARVYPVVVRRTSQARYVGDKWFDWTIEEQAK